MNGVSRFLSRREKHGDKRHSKHSRGNKTQPLPSTLYTIFSQDDQKFEKDDQTKIKTLVQRMQAAGVRNLGEAQAQYAHSKYPNDLDKAFDLLILANDSFDGILRDIDPNVTMLGAINRNMVTCYLDALLFAMFARLDSFEAMLFDNFSDEPRKKLAAILRLWVNLLRSGELISVDLTKHLQDALAKCGWEEAAEVCQQDASEAFTFITGALELPLLTLKMDIYHTGKEDKEDDHKFVNERLLEVAIPEQEGDKEVTLEDCLETYFNNRIEVKRYLQRQNTLTSLRTDSEKTNAVHIETVEIPEASSPLATTPTSFGPSTPVLAARPTINGRRRADSIFNERYTLANHSSPDKKKPFDEKRLLDEMSNDGPGGRPRSASLRKEVMMPAWQFFSLIPWYTDNVPKSDAQVAAHFSAKRPVLGICLKRYTMELNGTPKRLNTYIDIPLEIGLPHFISDDRMQEEGPLFGNFKLVLQSVVCHRGVSVDSGHYVSLIRANESIYQERPGSSQSEDTDGKWLRFDDLSNPRVTEVDIRQALREESPYLLFYQVQPINEDLARGAPPSYAEASRETLTTEATTTDTDAGDWEKVPSAELLNAKEGSEERIGRNSISSNNPSSIADDTEGIIQSLSRGRTAPTTPDEHKGGFLSSSRRGSKTWISKSRPSSQSGENRLSLTISRLTGRASKDKLLLSDPGSPEEPVIVINEVESLEASTNTATSPVKEKNTGSLGRSKSKKVKGSDKERRRLRSKSREPKEHSAHKEKHRPDRECVVM